MEERRVPSEAEGLTALSKVEGRYCSRVLILKRLQCHERKRVVKNYVDELLTQDNSSSGVSAYNECP